MFKHQFVMLDILYFNLHSSIIQYVLFASSRFTSERFDFKTHLIYATLIAELSANLKIISTLTPKLKASEVHKLNDKIKLVRLTKKSLDQEYEIVIADKDYSSASVLWLPIKSYYLLYHLLCITDCLITGKLSSLSASHYSCVDTFTKRLKRSEIQFNEPLLNGVFNESILSFKTLSGEHLKNDASDERVYKLLMKKVASDRIDEFKRYKSLSSRTVKDKAIIAGFQKTMDVSIFDFFHLMRLRMNYRNLNFVDNVSSSSTKAYFEKYYSSTDNFYKCLVPYIKDLIKKCP